MNINYAKTMLYAYPFIDSFVKRLEEKIINKAVNSMFDTSPCEEQGANILVLSGFKEDLLYMKHLVELMIMKFPMQDFDYFDYKYFNIRPKEEYKKKLKFDRSYYRKQDKLLNKFALILSAIGGSDSWFEDVFLNIPYIKNVYKKVITMEKANEKKKTSRKNSAKKL